ncbi:MAG: A/G-specific adenine glycosylase [Desulfobacterales bacterium]
MNAENLSAFRQKLKHWYEKNSRELPWRGTGDPYRIWVSEVMLQQTRVTAVIPYYERFVRRFPNPESLAASDLQEVLKLWEGLGYYARVRNLRRAAQTVMAEHGGSIPQDFRTFRQLPGVGDYTASAVLSIAFGRPLAAVDGNVKRVLARVFLLEEPVNLAAARSVFRNKADALLDREDPGVFNQAMMELGALVCTPRNPKCENCPLSLLCAGFQSAKTDNYPKRKAAVSVPEYHIAAGVVHREDKILIVQRPAEGLLGGLWEFPGGKRKEGESPEQACIREIREKTGITAGISSFLTHVKHAYTHFKIQMDVFVCRYVSGKIHLSGPADFRWIRAEEIRNCPFHKSNLKIVSMLK